MKVKYNGEECELLERGELVSLVRSPKDGVLCVMTKYLKEAKAEKPKAKK